MIFCSLLIILPLFYSTIWRSMCATVSTNIPSYKAMHGGMLYIIIILTIWDTFGILHFMKYPFLTHHDTESTCEISYRVKSTDSISELPWYVYWIDHNGDRQCRVHSRGKLARDASQLWRMRNHTDLKLKCPISIQSTMGQSHMATPKNEKSSGYNLTRFQNQRSWIDTPNWC